MCEQTGMEIKTLYETIGSDYCTVLERFCGHDNMLAEFAVDFLNDTTVKNLAEAIRTLNYQDIERQAHALKGVSGNLGFERLYQACGELVFCVRCDRLDEVPEKYQKVEEAYTTVCKAIDDIMNN